MHGGLRQLRIAEHQGHGQKNDQTANGAGDHGETHRFFRAFARFFQTAAADDVAQQNAGSVGGAKAEDGAEVAHDDYKRVGCHGIGAHVAQDHRVHGKTNAPDDVVKKGGYGKPQKVLGKELVAAKQIAQI